MVLWIFKEKENVRADVRLSPGVLEGSRFDVDGSSVVWQGLAARRLPGMAQRYAGLSFAPRFITSEPKVLGKTSSWVIPGSRLLPADRAAISQSGSPPGGGLWHGKREMRKLQTWPVRFFEDEDDDEDEDERESETVNLKTCHLADM